MDNSSTGDGRERVPGWSWSQPIAEPGDQAPVVEDRLEPTDFSPELKLLQRRFEVHGPRRSWPSCSPAS